MFEGIEGKKAIVTGGGAGTWWRPAGRSGWVYTPTTW